VTQIFFGRSGLRCHCVKHRITRDIQRLKQRCGDGASKVAAMECALKTYFGWCGHEKLQGIEQMQFHFFSKKTESDFSHKNNLLLRSFL